MNKKTIITILLALVAMAAQAQTFTWRIEGTVANAAPTDTLTVIDAERQRMITMLQVKDGNIVPASGTLEILCFYFILVTVYFVSSILPYSCLPSGLICMVSLGSPPS